MQRLEVSGAIRPIYGSLGVKRLISLNCILKRSIKKNTVALDSKKSDDIGRYL